MPANLTPEYMKAEEWFRTATTTDERILAVEQMLRVIPKHKGTDHLRADLRRRLSRLKETATQKKSGKQVDIFHVPRNGAGQIVLIGTANSGKSSILQAVTNAKVTVADFPFSTTAPVPGMVKYEDIMIQLVDMPPVAADYAAPGQVGTYRNCDLIAVVIDLSSDVVEQTEVCLNFLEMRKLLVNADTPEVDENGNVLGKRAFVICTKADIAQPGNFETLRGLVRQRFDFIEISVRTGLNMDKLPARFFELLNIIRIYAKPPGKPADMDEPFTLPKGSTVLDLARSIHRQLADKLKSARIWGTGVHSGQNVHRTHVLNDGDIIELHF